MKTVLTVGVFDLLHIGHIELFRKAKALGDRLVVAVQDSASVEKYKPGSPTVNGTAERMYVVKAIKYVDDVVVYTDVDKIMDEVDFDVFVFGGDQKHPGFQALERWCLAHGKEMVRLPRTEGISSSEIKEYIRSL